MTQLANIGELPRKLDQAMANFLRRMKEHAEKHDHDNTHDHDTEYSDITHEHDAVYAPIAKGVTNGDSHNHVGGDGAQIDHGGLAGLGDDDHTQYLKTDGSRTLAGNLIVSQASENASIAIVCPKNKDGYLLLKKSDDSEFWYHLTRNEANSYLYQFLNYYDGSSYFNFGQCSVSGEINYPYQPCFLVYPSTDQVDIAIDADATVVFDVETFDVGGNFASNVFTAPVTGKYYLSVMLRLTDIDTGATQYTLKIKTSNNIYKFVYDMSKFSADLTAWFFPASFVTDMDASDTAYVTFLQSGGTQQTDIIAAQTYFSGALLC